MFQGHESRHESNRHRQGPRLCLPSCVDEKSGVRGRDETKSEPSRHAVPEVGCSLHVGKRSVDDTKLRPLAASRSQAMSWLCKTPFLERCNGGRNEKKPFADVKIRGSFCVKRVDCVPLDGSMSSCFLFGTWTDGGPVYRGHHHWWQSCSGSCLSTPTGGRTAFQFTGWKCRKCCFEITTTEFHRADHGNVVFVVSA